MGKGRTQCLRWTVRILVIFESTTASGIVLVVISARWERVLLE